MRESARGAVGRRRGTPEGGCLGAPLRQIASIRAAPAADMRRIRQLSSHVASTAPPATSAATSSSEEASSSLAEPPGTLSDDSMLADYILRGFHVCTIDELPAEFHR